MYGRLFLFDLFLKVLLKSFALIFELHLLTLVFSSHLIDLLGVLLDLL